MATPAVPPPPEPTGPAWKRWLQLLHAKLGTLVDLDSAQTLENKALTAPTISGPTFSGAWGGSLTNISGTNIKDSTRCYAFARRTSQQSIPNTNYDIINFDTVDDDPLGAVTTGASWKFTVPVGHGGVYSVAATVCLAASAGAGVLAVGLFRNGTEAWRLGRTPSSALAMTHSGEAKVKLVAGDYLDVRAFQNSGAARNINEGPAATRDVQCQVSIIRLVTDL